MTLAMIKMEHGSVNEDVWANVKSEVIKISIDDLSMKLAPVYAKCLSVGGLRELIKFYNSPTGKKFAGSAASIARESMQIGQQWGVEIGERVKKQLKEKGY